MSRGVDVIAAGAIITRRGGREVLLVHRPKYDDWSFPKGKQDLGEPILATVVREVHEETGLRIHLGRPLPQQRYAVSEGRSKIVHYWVARLTENVGPFAPNSEVNEIQWLSLPRAIDRLSYLDDVEILEAFRSQPKRTIPLIIARHAAAQSRSGWKLPDNERPLSPTGRAQAQNLTHAFDAYGIAVAHTSPSQRCLETITPFAGISGIPVEQHPEISEENQSHDDITALVKTVLNARQPAVICSHRPVLPDLFAALNLEVEALAPAEFVVIHHRKGKIVGSERHQAHEHRSD